MQGLVTGRARFDNYRALYADVSGSPQTIELAPLVRQLLGTCYRRFARRCHFCEKLFVGCTATKELVTEL